MVIKNNEDSAVKMMYKGTWYELEAGESKDLSEEVCSHWKKIHAFLSVSESAPSVSAATFDEGATADVKEKDEEKEKEAPEKEKEEVEEKSTSKKKSNK